MERGPFMPFLWLGRSAPRGHFLPWIEEKSGITYSQAQRWMKAAKEADEQREAG
jgi:hypothetical protein